MTGEAGFRNVLVTLGHGVQVEVDRVIVDTVGEAPSADVGLYEVTQNPRDR